jgi:uncharacterized protein YecT (DUF1311 family)
MMRRQVPWLVSAMLALASCSSGSRSSSATAPRNTAPATSTVSAASNASARPEDRCTSPNTIALERCLTRVFAEVDRERVRLSASLIAASQQPDPSYFAGGAVPDLKKEWHQSETAFVGYRDRTCHAVYIASMQGTERGIQRLSCEIRLTRERGALLRDALGGKGV